MTATFTRDVDTGAGRVHVCCSLAGVSGVAGLRGRSRTAKPIEPDPVNAGGGMFKASTRKPQTDLPVDPSSASLEE